MWQTLRNRPVGGCDMQHRVRVSPGAGGEGDDSLLVINVQSRVEVNRGQQVPVVHFDAQRRLHGDHIAGFAVFGLHRDTMQPDRFIAGRTRRVRPDPLVGAICP